MKSERAASRIRFAGIEVDLRSGDLMKNGRRIHIQAQPLRALRVLLENPGEVVTREELRNRVWPDETFVDFDHGLNKAIAKLRDVLDDAASESSLIETLPKQGYRLLAFPELNVPPEESVISIPINAGRNPGITFKGVLPLAVGITLLIFLAAFSFSFGRRLMPSQKAPGTVHAIAVLPLENLSGDPAQEYFADGMTDELITMLAQNSSLRVISRTSVMQYKGVHRSLGEIAKRLGVEAVLEGTVSRSGDKVRVTAQLIYTPTDTHLWAESYVRDVNDVFEIQKEVAETVTARVNAKFSPADQFAKPTRKIKPEAYDAYLRGRYFWFADRRLDKSRALFMRAVTLQPDYAAAWSGLADAAMVRAVYGEMDPKVAREDGEKYVRKALELEDSLAEAHSSMGAVHLFFDWDWEAAEKEADRAIALNPNLAEAHHLRSYALQAMNRFDESIDEAKLAIALDPGARPWGLGYAYILTHRFDEALAELHERSEAHPDDAGLHYLMARAYKYKRMEKESFRELTIAMRLDGDLTEISEVEKVFASGGFRAISKRELLRRQQRAKNSYVSPLNIAEGFAELGDKEQTIHYLELALQERAPQLVRVHINPVFDFVHSDRRFVEVLRKIGLKSPDWSNGGHKSYVVFTGTISAKGADQHGHLSSQAFHPTRLHKKETRLARESWIIFSVGERRLQSRNGFMSNRTLLVVAIITLVALCTPAILIADAQGKSKGKDSNQAAVGDKHKSKEHKELKEEIKHEQKDKLKEERREENSRDMQGRRDQGWDRRDKFEYRS